MSLVLSSRNGQRRGSKLQVILMARKPNYDFERRERERLKNEKKAARASEKVKPASEEDGVAPEQPAEDTPPKS